MDKYGVGLRVETARSPTGRICVRHGTGCTMWREDTSYLYPDHQRENAGFAGAQPELPGIPCNPIANRNGSGGCRFEPMQDCYGLFKQASAPEIARRGYSAAAAALGRTRASSTPPAIATATNETATPSQPAACWMAPDTGAESSVPRLRPMFSTPSATPV